MKADERGAAMSDVVLIAIGCVLAGLAAGALVMFIARGRSAAPDPLIEAQKSAEASLSQLNARLDNMGSWLQSAHGQLQQTVNQRLDDVTARLGDTLTTSTKNTTDYLQQLHARLA